MTGKNFDLVTIKFAHLLTNPKVPSAVVVFEFDEREPLGFEVTLGTIPLIVEELKKAELYLRSPSGAA